MFNNESVVKSIARRVFPGMGGFSNGVAELGPWEVHLAVADEVTWLTVYLGRDELFRVEARKGRVKAMYALPAVMELGSGEKEYGTAWANSRHWRVDGWSDVPRVAVAIREFFDNTEEFLEEEAKVHGILGEAE